jgi:hypothetical protein
VLSLFRCVLATCSWVGYLRRAQSGMGCAHASTCVLCRETLYRRLKRSSTLACLQGIGRGMQMAPSTSASGGARCARASFVFDG